MNATTNFIAQALFNNRCKLLCGRLYANHIQFMNDFTANFLATDINKGSQVSERDRLSTVLT